MSAIDKLVQHLANVTVEFAHVRFQFGNFRFVVSVRRDAIHPRLKGKANSIDQVTEFPVTFCIFD